MAIRIPSKNTYDRNNPKVRDNVIERIEVNAVEVKDLKEYGKNVFSKKIIDVEPYIIQKENNSYSSISKKQNNQHPTYINYNEYNSHSYIDVTISIPKLQVTYLIENLLYGKKTDNSLNIGCSIFGTVKTETVGGTVAVSLLEGNNNLYTANITSKNLTYHDGKEIEENYAIPKELEINSYINVNIDGVVVPSNKVELLSSDTLASAVPTSDEDYYYITLTILCGIQTLSFSADTFGISDPNTLTVYKGERKTYTPKSIELQFYGNTIGIDLTDKTVVLGDATSKKVQSVEKNEFLQTSNYYQSTNINAIIRLFTDTLNDYAKGKETATIRCDINKYYDENGNLSINPYGKNLLHTEQLSLYGRLSIDKEGVISSLVTTDQRGWGYDSADIYMYLTKGTYTLGREKQDILSTNYSSGIQIFAQDGTALTSFLSYSENWETTFEIKETTKVGIMIKMYQGDTFQPYLVSGQQPLSPFEPHIISNFDIYDEVIPMVLDANGNDKPMSTYKDGSPKIFKVLGNKPFYDGAVWQELYLQEI